MEHFYTLQGEGFHSGKAAYFIRLGGCDVGCVWCDVKDSWAADKHPLSGDLDWITLSPKKFKAPLEECLNKADELKIVVYNRSDFKCAEQYEAKMKPGCRLYLQPEWSRKEEVTPLIIDYIKAHPQWQLSMQTHKYINIP